MHQPLILLFIKELEILCRVVGTLPLASRS